jgi:ubiquinone/menaquinone biosynthesis C-methylase UbiE
MVASTIAQPAVRLAYRGQQASLQYTSAILQALVRRVVLGERPGFTASEARAVRRRYRELLARDLANAEAGLYPRSLLFRIPLREYARTLPQLARDMPRVLRRMHRGDWKDLPEGVDLGAYPAYYRRTFHWQSDGYLSHDSARLYDVGVEFLFGGMADVMRRQAIGPLTRFVGGLDGRAKVLDVGCGTGRLLAQLRHALPHLELTGLDLSPFYLDEARRRLDGVTFVEANAEAMPLKDDAFDAAISVFLFHELPRNARRNVLREMARVVRPGGLLILVDAVQREEASDIAYFVERFSKDMHEPFFQDYVRDDLATALGDLGLEVIEPCSEAFMAKVVVARNPSRSTPP